MELLEALQENSIPYRDSQVAEGEVWICCPFCEEEGETPDTRFRLGVNFRTGKMNCFNCGKKSSDPQIIASELERALALGTMAEAGKQGKKKQYKETGPVRLPSDFTRFREKPDDYWGKKAWKYLRSRGVTSQQMRDNKIGYAEVGKYAYRIIFPVYYKKKLKGFVGRDFTGRARLKYKNSVGRKYLYLARNSVTRNMVFRRLVLSEGGLDALAIARGIDTWRSCGSAAVLGHILTDEQLKQIKQLKVREVILWLDPDKAGVEGISKIWSQLKDIKMKRVSVVVPEKDDKDPSDMKPSEVRKRLSVRRPMSEALADKMRGMVLLEED